MTLRHLEIFLKVADTGSMKAAADELYITQPTVSVSIAELEKEYNVKLFERLNKRLYITAAGEKLKAYARKMENLQSEILRQVGSMEDTAPIRIGATVTIGTGILPEFIRKLNDEGIKVWIDNTRNIQQGILNNSLDIGLVEGKVTGEDLIVSSFMRDEMMVICRNDYKYASKNSVSLQEISGEPMILREKNSGTRIVIDEALEQAGIKANVLWNCNNTQAILNAVEAGLGISILSPGLIKKYSDLKAIPLKDIGIERDFQLVIHKDKYISRRLADIMEMIKTDCEWKNNKG